DFHVTGVQTCALPILRRRGRRRCGNLGPSRRRRRSGSVSLLDVLGPALPVPPTHERRILRIGIPVRRSLRGHGRTVATWTDSLGAHSDIAHDFPRATPNAAKGPLSIPLHRSILLRTVASDERLGHGTSDDLLFLWHAPLWISRPRSRSPRRVSDGGAPRAPCRGRSPMRKLISLLAAT